MQQHETNNIVKKKSKISLIISYVFMTTAILIISGVCIFMVMGYKYDPNSNRIVQGALLHISSSPDSATIKLDGSELSFTTPGKRDISKGEHEVKLSLRNYRDWSKKFTVKSGEVRWLNYARLIPTDIKTSVVKEFDNIYDELPSPHQDSIFIIPKANSSKFILADIRDDKKTVFRDLEIPVSELTTGENNSLGVFNIVEWNLKSKYILIKHSYGPNSEKREFIRLNVSDGKDVVNLTKKMGVDISEIHFSSESIFYGIENGNLRRFDVNKKAMSEPIAYGVKQMRLYGSDDISMVQNAGGKFVVNVYVDGKVTKIEDYDETLPVLTDFTSYFNQKYLAISRGDKILLYKEPQKDEKDGRKKIADIKYISEVKWLDFSTNGRHVIAGNGNKFMTYDIELDRKTEANMPGTAYDPSKPVQWIDDYNLVSTAEKKVRIVDFEGDNQQNLIDALPGLPVTLSANKKFLYTFTTLQNGKYVLQSSKMVL